LGGVAGAVVVEEEAVVPESSYTSRYC
jgi:hypothetical protein